MIERLLRSLPHVVIVMALFLGTLWTLDKLNPLMGFMENPFAEAVQILFFITALCNGVYQAWKQI